MKNITYIRKAIQILACLPIAVGFINGSTYFLTFILILTAFAGAFYCGYLCPFGFLQEVVSMIGDKLKIKKRTIPPKLDSVMKLIRYFLYISIIIISISSLLVLLKYDARSNLYLILIGKKMNYVMITSILVFSLLSLFYKKSFCRYFCIKGAMYGLFSSVRIFTIKRNVDTCVNCKLCDRACDMGIKISDYSEVNSMNCINCFECIKKCPKKGTLKFGLVEPKLLMKKVIFAVSVALVVYVSTVYPDLVSKIITVIQSTGDVVEERVIETEETGEKSTNEGAVDGKESAEAHIEAGNGKDDVGIDKAPVVEEEVIVEDPDVTYYTGEAEGYNGLIKVKVGIKDNAIIQIIVTDHIEDEEWYVATKDPIINSIIETQSTEVDGITGATYTSDGIKEAVKQALEKAGFIE